MSFDDPITDAQLDYIEILIKKRRSVVQATLGESVRAGVLVATPDHLCELTKRQASKIITWLKGEEEE